MFNNKEVILVENLINEDNEIIVDGKKFDTTNLSLQAKAQLSNLQFVNEQILQIKLISFLVIWMAIIIYIYDSYKKEIILNKTQ